MRQKESILTPSPEMISPHATTFTRRRAPLLAPFDWSRKKDVLMRSGAEVLADVLQLSESHPDIQGRQGSFRHLAESYNSAEGAALTGCARSRSVRHLDTDNAGACPLAGGSTDYE